MIESGSRGTCSTPRETSCACVRPYRPAFRGTSASRPALDRSDEVERPRFDLVVDAADVFTQNADPDQLDAAEEQDRKDRRRVAGQVVAREDLERDLEDRDDERADADDEAEVRREAQRNLGERRDAVDRKAQHLRERILGRAGIARIAIVLDADLLEADPCNQSAQEAVVLAGVLERVDHAPAHQPEVAGVERDRDVRQAARDAVEQLRR